MIADEPTLARLMQEVQQGRKSACDDLMQMVGVWLERHYRRRVFPHEIEDLVQEVLYALYASRANWDPSRPFLPWLATIARNRWIDHLRKVYKQDNLRLIDFDTVEEEIDEPVIARASLERLLDQLSEGQATAIVMAKVMGLSIKEASRLSGQSESLVKANIHRGLKKLSAMVEESA